MRFLVSVLSVALCLAVGGCLGSTQKEPAQAAVPASLPEPTAPPVVADPEPVEAAPALETAAKETAAKAEPIQQQQVASATPTAAAEADWGALFVAGDHSIKAFDNATRRFYSIVERKPDVNLRRLTSDPAIAPSSDEIADVGTIDSSLAFITKDAREKCLVFMTSHGTRDGFYLSQAGGTGGLLPPRVLDQWLDNHCGARPTVVIVSACYSGIFLEEGMAQPNRIILTASRADRPSFGCGADETYTYYDKCLLDSWTWVYTWSELYDRTKACVAEREAALGAKPSEPQAYFGGEVANLQLP